MNLNNYMIFSLADKLKCIVSLIYIYFIFKLYLQIYSNIIQAIYSKFKKNKQQNKIKAINKIMIFNKFLNKDLKFSIQIKVFQSQTF